MADSCFILEESEVFDDQIVPDTDDCFLPPTDSATLLNSNPNVSWSNIVLLNHEYVVNVIK